MGYNGQSQPGAPGGGHQLKHGFTKLPTKFFVWSEKVGFRKTTYMGIGPEPFGQPYYSYRLDASKLEPAEFRAGPYKESDNVVCAFESKHILSSKTYVNFTSGFQALFHEGDKYGPGDSRELDVDVQGQVTPFQWTKKAESHGVKTIGDWELRPQGVPEGRQVMASFTGTDSTAFEKQANLGVFELHGPAARGELGEIFSNVAIATGLRLIGTHHEYRKKMKDKEAAHNAKIGNIGASVAAHVG